MKMCVIFNPMAARGRAAKRLEEIRGALGSEAVFEPTQGPRHAEELALRAAQSGFEVVAAAGGDGTVHEVANGLLRADRPAAAFAVFPMGSANDYAFSLGLKLEDLLRRNGEMRLRHVDVGVVRAENGRERYFVEGLGLGFNGAVTVESRKISWLQGLPLYGLAFFKAVLFHYGFWDMELMIDQEVRRVSTFALSIAIGKREGNLLVAPQAVVDDGLFDYLLAGRLSRFEVLRYLPGLAVGKLPVGHPALWTGRCREVKLRSDRALLVHLDGEFFCLPEDGLLTLDVRILPGRLPVVIGY